MKNRKRILSVKIKRMFDDSPDTSCLGEYSNHAKTEFAIDRAHSEGCASFEHVNATGKDWLSRTLFRVEDMGLDNPEVQDAEDLLNQCLNECEECDCGGHNVSSSELPYFNGNVENYKGQPDENIRTCIRQDYERMEGLNDQNWYYMGIRAEAEIAIPGGKMAWNCDSTIQHITSGGLWGIESDSDKEYIASVEQEELSDLKTQLLALGFSKRAISTAFKNVQEVSE